MLLQPLDLNLHCWAHPKTAARHGHRNLLMFGDTSAATRLLEQQVETG